MVKKIILLTVGAFILSGEGRCSFVTRELLSPAIRRICFSENHLAVCSAFSPQKRYLTSGHTTYNRYMSFPKAPDWMLSKPQSHSSCATVDESWTQHYNPVDDVFYYQSLSDNSVAPSYEEAHVSNSNKIVRVRDQGTHVIKK